MALGIFFPSILPPLPRCNAADLPPKNKSGFSSEKLCAADSAENELSNSSLEANQVAKVEEGEKEEDAQTTVESRAMNKNVAGVAIPQIKY